jgi:hypothetical protein
MLHGSAKVGGPMLPSRWRRTLQGGGNHHATEFAPPPMDPPRGRRSSHWSTTRRPLSVAWRTREQRRKERGREWREEEEGAGVACRWVLLPAGIASDSGAMEPSRRAGAWLWVGAEWTRRRMERSDERISMGRERAWSGGVGRARRVGPSRPDVRTILLPFLDRYARGHWRWLHPVPCFLQWRASFKIYFNCPRLHPPEKKTEIVQASDRHPPDADKFLVLSNARRRF